eukprot:COSAG05_NODE_723_length_7727_cov_19.327871_3_plen_101_part_00
MGGMPQPGPPAAFNPELAAAPAPAPAPASIPALAPALEIAAAPPPGYAEPSVPQAATVAGVAAPDTSTMAGFLAACRCGEYEAAMVDLGAVAPGTANKPL